MSNKFAPRNKVPPKKNHYVEDVQYDELFVNPFIDLSRPFRQHLDIPDDLIEKALGEELQSTKRIKMDFRKLIDDAVPKRK